MNRIIFVILLIFNFSFRTIACSCTFAWNDSFIRTAKKSEFVALIKVISFDKYLEREILGYDGKMPYSMTVEIIKKFKGKKQRRRIRILGDDGIMCRPYLSVFKINGYYLIAPIPLDDQTDTEYEFYACRTDFLEVDIAGNKAYGDFSLIRKQIDISTFENKLKYGDWDLLIVGAVGSILIFSLIILQRNKKRNVNMS